MGRLVREFRHLPRILCLVYEAAGWRTPFWAALLLAEGAIPLLTVVLSRQVVDQLLGSLRTGRVEPTVAAAAGLVATVLAGELVSAAAAHLRTVQAELVRDHIHTLVHGQSVRAGLAFYDSADFHDHLHRARAEAAYRPVELLESLGATAQAILTLSGFTLILAAYAWWLPLVFIAGAIPALALLLRSSLLFHQWRRQTTSTERRTWYLDWLLTAAETAAEIRLFNLGGLFSREFGRLRTTLRQQRIALAVRQTRDRLVATMLAFVAAGFIGTWVLFQALAGRFTPGDLVLFYQALQQGLRLVHSLLGNATEIYSSTLFLGNLFEFLDLEPDVVRPAEPCPAPSKLTSGIRFNQVSFSYPGAEIPAIEGLDLSLAAGKMTAVAGANGSGKSTLIKLLCRFYDPQRGSIELDGIDLRRFDPAELRLSITGQLQDSARFHDTFASNIWFGDVSSPPDHDRIRQAIAAASASAIAAGLPSGLETMLGRDFESGHELSAGQWQRLALARAFYRQTPLLILDEPTALMDPWSEAEWLAGFRSLTAGQTVLLITHRFTAARHADMIHILDAGRIVESGCHAELMRLGGLYAQGCAAQAGGGSIR